MINIIISFVLSRNSISCICSDFDVLVLALTEIDLLILRDHLSTWHRVGTAEENCWWLTDLCASDVFVLVSLAPASASKHAHCEPHCTEHYSHNHSRHTNSSGQGDRRCLFTVTRCGLHCTCNKNSHTSCQQVLCSGIDPIYWNTKAFQCVASSVMTIEDT